MGNSPSSVPYGAQIGYLNITANCNSSFDDSSGSIQYSTSKELLQVSVTAPLLSNSQFNYTDISVSSPGGSSIYGLIVLATAIFSTGASPATFQLSSSQIIQEGTYGSIDVPVSGVTNSPAITMGASPVQLSLSKFEIDARNADITIISTCTPSPHIIATTDFGQSLASSNAPANGFASSPSTPVDSVTNIANFPLSCGGSASYGLIFGGTVPAYIRNGAQVLVSGVNAFFSLMAGSDTNYALTLGKDPSGNSVVGFSAELSGSTLVETDIAREFIASDPSTSNPLSGASYTNGQPQSLTLALPYHGSLSKNLTSDGSPFSLSLSNLQGTLNTNTAARFVGCKIGSNTLLSAPVV